MDGIRVRAIPRHRSEGIVVMCVERPSARHTSQENGIYSARISMISNYFSNGAGVPIRKCWQSNSIVRSRPSRTESDGSNAWQRRKIYCSTWVKPVDQYLLNTSSANPYTSFKMISLPSSRIAFPLNSPNT